MKKRLFFLFTASIICSSCGPTNFYYNSGIHEGVGLLAIHINHNKTKFSAVISGCEKIKGKIKRLSKDTLVLISSFQPKNMNVVLSPNNYFYGIKISGLPPCFTDKYKKGFREFVDCYIDSIILITKDERIKITDSSYFSTSPYVNGKIQIFVPSNIGCKPFYYINKSYYEYKLPYSDTSVNYNLLWDWKLFREASLNDTFIIIKHDLYNPYSQKLFGNIPNNHFSK